MEKQTIVRDMKSFVNGSSFMNLSQFAKYMKRSRDIARDLTVGLDYMPSGKAKQYFIPDLAGRIMEQRRVG